MNDSSGRNDEHWMRLAIEEACRGDAPYGAVLVKDGKVVARGFNTVRRDGDSTAHAEINVVRAAQSRTSLQSLEGCTLYATGEPCAMCVGAAVWAGVSQIVFGASVAQLAEAGQRQIGVSSNVIAESAFRPIDIRGGVLADAVLELFADKE